MLLTHLYVIRKQRQYSNAKPEIPIVCYPVIQSLSGNCRYLGFAAPTQGRAKGGPQITSKANKAMMSASKEQKIGLANYFAISFLEGD